MRSIGLLRPEFLKPFLRMLVIIILVSKETVEKGSTFSMK